MWFWKIIYWAVIILYVCAIGILALIFAACVVVIVQRLVRGFRKQDGKTIDDDVKRADRGK